MEKKKKARLVKAGWKVGSVKEFLGLSSEESTQVSLDLIVRSLLATGKRQREIARALAK